MKIAVCAGHYAGAKGADNHKFGLNEHDEAKLVVSFLVTILVNLGHSVSVFSGGLTKKVNNINNGLFDLAFDIHFNSGGGHGCEVMHVPHSPKRAHQAAIMSSVIATALGCSNRGSKEGWWQGGKHPGTLPDFFLTETNCPAFIPELFFIDNDEAVEKWFIGKRHKELAEAIAEAIGATFSDV